MAKNQYGQIAIYPNETVRRLIEQDAAERNPGSDKKPLGPTVLAIVVEYFKKKKKL